MFASLLFAAAVSAATGCLKYEPSVVHLRGRIVERWDYGPPGYGEDPKHDRWEGFLVLKLDQPICVDAKPADELDAEDEANVTELMMAPPDGHRLPRGRAMVTGTLFHAITAHHRTRVLIAVTGAQSLNAAK
jgi:hypothetical protein